MHKSKEIPLGSETRAALSISLDWLNTHGKLCNTLQPVLASLPQSVSVYVGQSLAQSVPASVSTCFSPFLAQSVTMLVSQSLFSSVTRIISQSLSSSVSLCLH